jgi:hypothetical protein
VSGSDFRDIEGDAVRDTGSDAKQAAEDAVRDAGADLRDAEGEIRPGPGRADDQDPGAVDQGREGDDGVTPEGEPV